MRLEDCCLTCPAGCGVVVCLDGFPAPWCEHGHCSDECCEGAA